MALKLRAPVPFPANVAGAGGIKVTKANGTWTIEPGFDEIGSVASLPDPSAKQIWVYDPATDEYAVLTLSALAENLFTATSTTSVAIGTDPVTLTTQSGRLFLVGSFVVASSDADPSDYMILQVTSYTNSSLTGDLVSSGGSGTHADWTISAGGTDASAAADYAVLASDWAKKTSDNVDGSEFSAKEYAQGTQASTGGSAKNWAQQTGADVTGASTNDRSAKSWAQDDLSGATLGGSAKDWASHTGGTVDGTNYSAKKYATDAAASETAAATSATNAATSATAAQTAQAAAEDAQAAAESAADNFDDVYLGSHASDPTLDNDGNALVEGQLYWNTATNALKVYDSSAWQSYNPLAGISSVVEDTTPQLGGNLDLNGHVITGLEIGTDVQAFDAQLSSLVRQNSKSAAYTTVLADAGKHLLHPSADTTARVFTIDSNANVAYPVGTTLTFVNQNGGGAITISITSDTMRLAGSGTTGSRTLAANGIATALKITSTEWIISGVGLT